MRRLFVFILWVPMFCQAAAGQDADTWLARGHEAEIAGEYEEALQIWTDARRQLDEPSLAIAVEYLRLVTEQQMETYYPIASSLYMWGLSGVEISEEQIPVLEGELARLEPLVTDNEYEIWSDLLESKDPLLLERLRGFWTSLNAVPSRPYNIRLLEHWERIAFARAHYTRSDDSPYGTDDRGVYYVKYGDPDRKVEDVFPLSTQDILKVFEFEEIHMDTIREMHHILYQRTGAPHYYELWIYNKPPEMFSNLILIFGQSYSSGFGRLNTLEELIPDNMFSTLLREPYYRKATRAMIEIYYEHLMAQDIYFTTLYQEIRRIQDPLTFKYRSLSETAVRFRNTPDQISAEEKSIPPIPVEVYQYRALNEQGDPVLLSFVESRPTTAFIMDQDEIWSSDAEELLGQYRLSHGLRLSDEYQRTLTQARYQPDLWIDPIADSPSTSFFTVPYISTETNQLFYSELENTNLESVPRFESLVQDEIRGMGKVELMQPEPLPSDGTLLLGDLIMGYQKQEQSEDGSRFPFVVSNTRQIPEGENLVIHFELYNLALDGRGITNFDVDYDIRSVRNILFWDRTVSNDDLSITLSFQHDTSRFTESLEIETQGLEPGEYELVFEATDLTNENETIQEIRFEIIEDE